MINNLSPNILIQKNTMQSVSYNINVAFYSLISWKWTHPKNILCPSNLPTSMHGNEHLNSLYYFSKKQFRKFENNWVIFLKKEQYFCKKWDLFMHGIFNLENFHNFYPYLIYSNPFHLPVWSITTLISFPPRVLKSSLKTSTSKSNLISPNPTSFFSKWLKIFLIMMISILSIQLFPKLGWLSNYIFKFHFFLCFWWVKIENASLYYLKYNKWKFS